VWRVSRFASYWGLSWEAAVHHLANIHRITRDEEFDRLCEATRKKDQSLPGLPWRIAPLPPPK